MNRTVKLALWSLAVLMTQGLALGADDYYTEPQRFEMRPNPGGERDLGQIGVTGIKAWIYKGVKITVEGTEPGTPADGKFEKGQIILGVNGMMLKGRNPLVVLGNALTAAEAKDGVMSFDVQSGKAAAVKTVTITIPVLGAYSETFPVNCRKSTTIIKQAAEFYAQHERLKGHHLQNGYACLFLLSTGDDTYVPRVREYFAQFLNKDGTAGNVGDNSWHNGPNGVACAEYYLRTGDTSVLPLLQYYCNDARDRQRYGVGWGHWGGTANPAYESGGGMQHSPGSLMLMTLVLSKACGVDVDDATLTGALRHWYHFVGHGAIPISDQRNWGAAFWCASRDGLTAAIMHVATRARGDVTIYRKAKAYLTLSTVTTLPRGYWDLIGQSLGMGFMLDLNPELYHGTMQRTRWMYDLGRQASGGFWFEGPSQLDAMGCGLVLALGYTAPLKHLYLNGAQSQYAQEFSLPERLWGTEADLAFLSAEHHQDFDTYGKEEEVYVPFRTHKLPNDLRYTPEETKGLSLKTMLRCVRHARYTVRNGAAKALQFNGHCAELENLLRDPDPRLRRAALDGINDCRPWFGDSPVWRYPLPPEKYTPAMCEAITKILNDPEESWFVVEGALLALYHAPVELIERNIPRIMAWKRHEEWWLRDAAFHALMGFRNDEERFVTYLPTITDIMVKEYPYNPRHRMTQMLEEELKTSEPGSRVHALIVAGLTRAARESTVLPDVRNYNRSNDGLNNIQEAVWAAIQHAPESAPNMAEALVLSGLLKSMTTEALMNVVRGNVHGHPVGLCLSLQELSGKEREGLADILYNAYRPELIARFESAEKTDNRLVNLILDLTRLKQEVAGWQPIGNPAYAERVWRYRSFDPLTQQETLHPREGKRMRKIALPADMEGWFKPEFDDSTWNRGKAPVGTGVFTPFGHVGAGVDGKFFYPNASDWGKGEFIAMRTTFELTENDLKKDLYRIRILTPMGFTLYLNGVAIHDYGWWYGAPAYNEILLDPRKVKHFTQGRNTLSVHSVIRYRYDRKTDTYTPFGQVDAYFEALKASDLGL